MNDDKSKPKIAVVTLIQEGAVKVGGEHAMLFPYVEQIINAADKVKEKITIIPYVITPRPKKMVVLPQVEELKTKMAETNNGEMILVSNGAAGPYANPWNWEKYGHEANKEIVKLAKKEQLNGIIIMAHGFASIPAILDLETSKENGEYGEIPILDYYVTHSTFDEHKDNRSQRKILEREVHHHAKMIAISPYMAQHLESIKMIEDSKNTIPLYNALPEKGWFSNKVPKELTLEMIQERNSKINKGPFYGVKLPIEDIIEGKKELVLYFGRAQKYVKGTDAVIACAKNDPKRHYMLICSGSNDELKWHKDLIKGAQNITLAWEHNSKLVLGMVQLSENNDIARIYSLFLSRREPMGLVSREVVLMQDNGSVLPIVSDGCGFEDVWQKAFSFLVTNPSSCEDVQNKREFSKLDHGSDIFIHDNCIQQTIAALNNLSKLSIKEIRERVNNYKEAVKKHYSQDRYLVFYLQATAKLLPNQKEFVEKKIDENNLTKIDNV
ncbi:MAG: glycosyltransferase family 4 protein [Asgard group archaeon]|nr:glycosyltransferase family 4 protein [Asgard group archaeon]